MFLGVYARGSKKSTEGERLNLQPGEWVEVKPMKQIRETLNSADTHRGLFFSPDMRLFCGKRRRVRQGTARQDHRGWHRRDEATEKHRVVGRLDLRMCLSRPRPRWLFAQRICLLAGNLADPIQLMVALRAPSFSYFQSNIFCRTIAADHLCGQRRHRTAARTARTMTSVSFKLESSDLASVIWLADSITALSMVGPTASMRPIKTFSA
jgi:hypothetical protein